MGFADLQQLINSLDKAERRYVSLQTERGSDYARLLAAITQHPNLPEDALKQKLGYTTHNRKYYDTRTYLFSFLVEQLTAYWDTKRQLTALPASVRHAQTLLWKGLPAAALELAARALPKATEAEDYAAQLHLLQVHYEATVLVHGPLSHAHELSQLEAQMAACVAEQNTILHLKSVLRHIDRSLAQHATGMVADAGQRLDLQALGLGPTCAPTGASGRFLHHTARALAALFNAQAEEALQWGEQAWALLEGHPVLVDHFPNEYLNLWRVLLVADIILRRPERVSHKLQLLKSLNASNQRLPRTQQQVLRLLQFNLGVQCEQDQRTPTDLLRELDELLAATTPNAIVNRYVVGLSYNAALIELHNGRPRDALQRLGRMMHTPPAHFPPGSYAYWLLLELILLLENGHRDTLEHKLRATKRYLAKHGLETDFERETMAFLAQCARAESPTQEAECIRAYVQLYTGWRVAGLHFPKTNFLDVETWAENRTRQLGSHTH
jgi:hypothetical protein